MYRMVIADDEPLARYAFRTFVTNNFRNIQIVGEAESGRQVIKLNRELMPDILVIDIKMPGINGLDASVEILNEYPGANILLLTAYDNFGYVKQALNMGVKGYLLKPMDREEAVNKINKLLSGIDQGRYNMNFKENELNKMNTVKPYIEKEVVQAFITGNADVEEIKSYMNFLQYKIESGYFMLISLGQNYTSYINDSVKNKFYMNKVCDVVVEHMPFIKKCIVGNPIGNTVSVFIVREGCRDCVFESKETAEEIKRKIKVISGVEVAIGIGNPRADIREYKQSYDEARFAIKKAEGFNGIVHFSEVKDDYVCRVPRYPYKLEGDFLEQFRIGNIEKAKELLNSVIDYIFNSYCNVDLIKEYVGQLITILKRNMWQMGVNIDSLSDSGSLIELNNLLTLEEIEVWLKRSMHTILHEVERKKLYSKNGALIQVYELVNSQFCKDITLEMAAEEVGLSPQYLSKLFKEEYGANFIDFITEKRITLAKNLLETGDKNIKDISNLVGYSDTNYFSRIFKKHTGLTPRQYRSKRRRVK